jgi:adenine-specific DNA-methyltransferase
MPILQFKGKTVVQNHHLTLDHHQLVPAPELSVTDAPSLNDNLIIHGDNLLALKALLPSFGGKIKCIYIDPPYNTGNEDWAYNDNVNSPMHQAWLGKHVDRDDLTRHDKWLCMMLPRLKLLHELLRDDGAIFVSIDDNEQHHLRVLMDEVFGEENFVADIIWQKNFSIKNDAKYFSEDHDFIIVYAKKVEEWVPNLLLRTEKQTERYKNIDNDSRGPWASSDLLRMEHRDNGVYVITSPTGKDWKPKPGTSWRHPEEEMLALIADNQIWFGEDGTSKPRRKRFLRDVKQGIVPQTIWQYEEVGHTQEATQELARIIEHAKTLFVTPKPSRLIKRILQIATDPDSIILDSFAGSGTTAHATLALNAEDGGSRRFILIEQMDYADHLTAERVRRVIRGVPGAKDAALREGYGGSFTFLRLGPPLAERQLLEGEQMPSYRELARYVFFTATGEQWDETQWDAARNYLGESRQYHVYLLYEPDPAALRHIALTLDLAYALREQGRKPRLVIAPYKLVDDGTLRDCGIEFCQLPFEMYRFRA